MLRLHFFRAESLWLLTAVLMRRLMTGMGYPAAARSNLVAPDRNVNEEVGD